MRYSNIDFKKLPKRLRDRFVKDEKDRRAGRGSFAKCEPGENEFHRDSTVRAMFDARSMAVGLICGTWEALAGRRASSINDDIAMTFAFGSGLDIKMTLQGGSYVGVFIETNLGGRDEMVCLCRHDSCWRTDGVEEFVSLMISYGITLDIMPVKIRNLTEEDHRRFRDSAASDGLGARRHDFLKRLREFLDMAATETAKEEARYR